MVSSTSGEVIRAPGLNVWDTGNGGILLFHVQPELHPSLECWGVFQVSVEGLEGLSLCLRTRRAEFFFSKSSTFSNQIKLLKAI